MTDDKKPSEPKKPTPKDPFTNKPTEPRKPGPQTDEGFEHTRELPITRHS
jgi:hypothetical protein